MSILMNIRIIPDVPQSLAGVLSFELWSVLFLVLQALVIFFGIGANSGFDDCL